MYEPIVPDRKPRVVDPRAMVVMKDTRSAGEIEPKILSPLEVGQPPFAGIAARESW